MDMRPIGVFDSGVGGLTALRELKKLLPGEDYIYFGDTARVPYGIRSRETLLQFARDDIALLQAYHPKAIVVACGTLSATVLAQVQTECDIPLFGVVIPAAAEAAANGGRTIGLIGTEASIRSGAYEREIRARNTTAQVISPPCPKIAPLVESGRFQPEDAEVRAAAEEYLLPLKARGVESLVLGCTHYPLLEEVIGRTMGPRVKLIDTGAVCARAAVKALTDQGLLADRETGSSRYLTSGDPDTFRRLAPIFLRGEPVETVELKTAGKG